MNKFINIAILVILVVFISFRINVACNELSKENAAPGNLTSQIELPSFYYGTLTCTTCPETYIEMHFNRDIYSETRQYSTRDFMPYSGMGNWKVSGDTLTTYKDSGLTNLTFLIRADSLYWLRNGRKVRQLQGDNWNYLIRGNGELLNQ
jgi:hypothetical protein